MRNIAIDTNAYRALEEGHPEVVAVARQATIIGLPVVVVGELYYEFEHGSKRQKNSEKLHQFRQNSRVTVLDITEDTARIFGEIFAELRRVGGRIQQNDVWIAALCKQYGYTLVTVDKGFLCIAGLDVISFRPS